MRKPIKKSNCLEVGYIKKTHGVKGDLSIIFHDEILHNQEKMEFVFFEIDGLLVPFFIENGSASNFKFHHINTKEQAQEFVGCKIFLDKEDIQVDEENLTTGILVGFTLYDTAIGEIGEILGVDDFGGNIVLTVNYQHDEVMIPYSEELVTAFNLEESTLEMDCPEGIFDLEE